MLLAIESSCDESALALFDKVDGVVYSAIHSQIATHTPYGGVVPELAVREHLQKFPELLGKLPIPLRELTAVAVTVGPGLVGSLAIGISLARAIALQHHLPLYGVNHLRAHAFSPFISLHKSDSENFCHRLGEHLPHLGLLVSGGNTLLYEIAADYTLSVVAKTCDDAAGEALDKAAKMLGLGYPGGPLMEKLATEFAAQSSVPAVGELPTLPIAFKGEKERLAFSFSGLKTSLRYFLQTLPEAQVQARKGALCHAYQSAVVENLLLITRRALEKGRYRSLGLCGGVAQNGALRRAFGDLSRQTALPLLVAEPSHCGDNAAMIAFAAFVDPQGLLPVSGFAPSLSITNANQ